MAKAVTTPDEPAMLHDVARQIVNQYTVYGAASGLLPLPGLDVAAIVGTQIKMIAELAQLYDKPFAEHAVKGYVAALLGGVLPVSGFTAAFGSAVKAVPGIGTLLGMFVMPGVAGASTWAVGKIFAAHFESGGDLADFNVDAARERFRHEFARARNRVKAAVGGAKPAEA